MKFKELAIYFFDSDYTNTFYPFIQTLIENDFKPLADETLEEFRTRLEKIMKESLYGFYITCQNKFRYDVDKEDQINYFFNTPGYPKILINEEVADFLAKKDTDSNLWGATFDENKDTWYFWIV